MKTYTVKKTSPRAEYYVILVQADNQLYYLNSDRASVLDIRDAMPFDTLKSACN